MRRSLNLTLLAGTLAVLACWLVELGEICGANLFPASRHESIRLDQLRQQRDSFAPHLQAVIGDVARGTLSLREACHFLHREAAESYPEFLKHVDNVIPGDNLEAKLARTVLHYVLENDSANGQTTSTEQRDVELHRDFQRIVMEQGQ